MNKPTYDDLVLLIAFIRNWVDRFPDIMNGLEDDDVRESLVNTLDGWMDRKTFERASRIFASLKEDIEKINLDNLEERYGQGK